jgi:hypothetical protein
VLVAAFRVAPVAAVLILGVSLVVAELAPALEDCVVLLESSSSELLLACCVDEERSRPPPLLKAAVLDERTETDALPETPVGVARICTLVLVEPHT